MLTARLIVLLIEVEERRLDLRSAFTSMFDFRQRRLGMSQGEAFRRITAARLMKRFPALLTQCTFVSKSGARARSGGTSSWTTSKRGRWAGTNAAENLRVRCRAHNRVAAEEVFGKAHVAEQIDFRQRKSGAKTALAAATGHQLDVRDLLRGAIAARA